MKRFLLILSLFLVTAISAFAQDDEDDDNESVRDKMSEYIQQKLSLGDQEAKKFRPAFNQYFREWRATIRENKGDKIVMQKKIADLQIRYRDQFRDFMGEKKSNDVFVHQRVFLVELRKIQAERRGNRPRRGDRGD